MEQDFRTRLLEWCTHAIKIVGAFAIAWFFIVSLMVATAQQQAIARLQQHNLNMDYGTALDRRADLSDKYDQAQDDRAYIAQLNRERTRITPHVQDEAGQVEIAWADFRQRLAALEKANLCDLTYDEAAYTPDRVAVASSVERCSLDSSATPTSVTILNDARSQARAFSTLANKYVADDRHLSGLEAELKRVGDERTGATPLAQGDKDLISVFGDLDAVAGMLPGGGMVASFPPTLLQIVLTFVSGLFGALLVTLVLIVYPSNQIMTVADARPVTRTFLGGFIALCVYIVLLGGSAVLGSAASESGAGDNYMAFAGIGILAGMFSDRVAGWLSKRADEFFKQ
jgi:cell division protein FtsB